LRAFFTAGFTALASSTAAAGASTISAAGLRILLTVCFSASAFACSSLTAASFSASASVKACSIAGDLVSASGATAV